MSDEQCLRCSLPRSSFHLVCRNCGNAAWIGLAVWGFFGAFLFFGAAFPSEDMSKYGSYLMPARTLMVISGTVLWGKILIDLKYLKRAAAPSLSNLAFKDSPELLRLLSSSNKAISREAERVLGWRKDPALLEPLLGIISHRNELNPEHSGMVETAMRLLILLGPVAMPGVRALFPDKIAMDIAVCIGGESVTRGLLEELALSPHPYSHAAQALSTMGQRADSVLLPALKDGRRDIRLAVIEVMRCRMDRNLADALIPLLNDPDIYVRDRAAKALESLGWKPATRTEGIAYSIASSQWEKVADYGEQAIEPLMRHFDDRPPGYQESIINTISAIRCERTFGILAALTLNQDWGVATAAALSLFDGDQRTCSLVTQFISRCLDGFPNQVAKLVQKVGRLDTSESRDWLLNSVNSTNSVLRSAVFYELAYKGDPVTVPKLLEMMSDPSKAEWALGRLTLACQRSGHLLQIASLRELASSKVRMKEVFDGVEFVDIGESRDITKLVALDCSGLAGLAQAELDRRSSV